MPVIINDLEIILETRAEAPAQATSDGGSGAEADATGRAIAPTTLARVEAHLRERAARLRSH